MTRWRGTMSRAESDRRHNLFRANIGNGRGQGWRQPIMTMDGTQYDVIGAVTVRGEFPITNDNTKEKRHDPN